MSGVLNVAKPVSPEERERIIAEFATGKSCNEIARQFNRSTNTISRIARSVDHQFAQVNAARAREVNKGYTAERRANVRLKTVELVEQTLQEFNEPTLVFNFGGKDNDYNEHTLDKPDARTKRDLAQTAATLWRIVKDIDAAEQTESLVSGLDSLFAELDLIADEHSERPVQPKAGRRNQPE